MSALERTEAALRGGLEAAREALDELLALPAAAGFLAVVRGLDRVEGHLDGARSRASLYSAVHPEKPVRDMADELEQELVAFQTELGLNRDVYERFARLDPAAAPGPEERRYLEHTLRDFRRAGVDRDEATRQRVRALRGELVEVGQAFDRNIVEDTRTIRLAGGHAELEGLPDDFLAAHPEAPDGAVTVSTDSPDFVPVMTFARDPEVRRRLYFEYTNRAWPQNGPVLDALLAKRHELATLLGHETWAAYALEDKMVERPQVVRDFVDRVRELARERASTELDELLAAKREEQPGAATVMEWERMYLTERVKARKHGFRSQEARPYFAYEQVLAGVLATSERLFGVELRPNREQPVWHPSVRCYDLLEGGEVVARCYLDMHPREGKYKHAAMFDFQRGAVDGPLAEGALVCNFPEPKDGDPALLMHGQVTTFFHEFGHLLHHLFAGRVRYRRFSGVATEWDFVEVPSQLYEEWAWDVDVLQCFATHHETGEPIPAELVARMKAADEYGKGLQVAVQMFYARLSLDLHDRDPAGLDTTAFMERLKDELLPLRREPDTHFQASFGHLHGYSAAYYTYMWSLVIAKDLLGVFGADLMAAEAAAGYRAKVLAPGGSKDAAELVRDFLGREYEFAAYESWLNA